VKHDLPLTGERTIPGVPHENYWFRRHEAAYQALTAYCRDRVVLEAGAGEGYGAAMLAHVARKVIALDYDWPTCEHAARSYPELAVARGNLAALPAADASVDVVACLQVLEHLWDQPGFIAECKRVLRPGGRLLITTPNRLTFSPGTDAPVNPFHSREFSHAELVELLEPDFGVAVAMGVRHGEWLQTLDAGYGGSLVDAQLAAPVEEWPDTLRDDVAGLSSKDFVLSAEDLDSCLDLVLVALPR
jgi:SAM-dependent methyltransferase